MFITLALWDRTGDLKETCAVKFNNNNNNNNESINKQNRDLQLNNESFQSVLT